MLNIYCPQIDNIDKNSIVLDCELMNNVINKILGETSIYTSVKLIAEVYILWILWNKTID